MKKLIITLLILTRLSSLYAQHYDLIVKTNWDSIACRIDSISTKEIYFEVMLRNTWIHTKLNLSEVHEYKYDAVDEDTIVFKDGTSFIVARKRSETMQEDDSKTYVILTYDGGEFLGEIVREDEREVVVETKDRGLISIPKYQIKEMKKVKINELTVDGEYMPEQVFATRYFFTTNGLPINEGESYVLYNWFGPDFQFGVADNVSLGVITSWLASPIVGSVKYSSQINDNTSFGIGTLLGTGSWISMDFGLALPFASFTLGDRRSNITFSGGYGALWGQGDSDGRTLLSVAAMTKTGKKSSFVFDSFIVPGEGAILVPCIRLQTEYDRAFQFGFAGFISGDGSETVPIPMVQWYRKF